MTLGLGIDELHVAPEELHSELVALLGMELKPGDSLILKGGHHTTVVFAKSRDMMIGGMDIVVRVDEIEPGRGLLEPEPVSLLAHERHLIPTHVRNLDSVTGTVREVIKSPRDQFESGQVSLRTAVA